MIEDVEEAEESDDVSAIFSDLISFVAALFILLFTLAYNKETDETYFIKMSAAFGGKKIEQTKTVSSEDLFVNTLQGYVHEQALSQYVLILVNEQKIRLVMNDPILFYSGTAKLKPNSKKVLNGFVNIMKEMENPIMVDGHTDNVPIQTGQFPSNWHLSAYRAAEVLSHLMFNGLDPRNTTVLGYGDLRPLESNDTDEGRRRNRRVLIHIEEDFYGKSG